MIFGQGTSFSTSFLTNERKRQLSNYNASIVTSKRSRLLTAFYLHEKVIMVFIGEIKPSKRACIKYLTQGKKLSIKARQCRVSWAMAYRIKKDNKIDRDQWNTDFGGRLRKLSLREERHILRTLSSLRHEEGNFTSIRLMARAGISPKHVSNRTIRQFLQRKGYYFLQARKKGLLSEKGLKRTVTIRQKYQKRLLKRCVERQCSFLFRLR